MVTPASIYTMWVLSFASYSDLMQADTEGEDRPFPKATDPKQQQRRTSIKSNNNLRTTGILSCLVGTQHGERIVFYSDRYLVATDLPNKSL